MASASGDHPDPGPPLWSIGFAVTLMLGAPLLIYAISPTGPVRAGDTIFSAGAANVSFANPLLYESARFDGSCLLDPADPLMVIQRPTERPDGLVLAKVQGKTAIEWPFCPPQAEVLLTVHQVQQRSAIWTEVRDRLAGWIK